MQTSQRALDCCLATEPKSKKSRPSRSKINKARFFRRNKYGFTQLLSFFKLKISVPSTRFHLVEDIRGESRMNSAQQFRDKRLKTFWWLDYSSV